MEQANENVTLQRIIRRKHTFFFLVNNLLGSRLLALHVTGVSHKPSDRFRHSEGGMHKLDHAFSVESELNWSGKIWVEEKEIHTKA